MREVMTYLPVRVLERQQLSPHLVRLRLGDGDIATFTSRGTPDEALLLVLPTDGATEPPQPGPDGTYDHLDGLPECRWYTVRRVETVDGATRSITLDVVLHEQGLATRWARTAAPGDPVVISTTRSWFTRPDDARWQLLLGDVTALPAIGRAIEERPAGLPTTAIVEVPGAADEQQFGVADGLDVRWVHNPELGVNGGSLASIGERIELPAGPGYVYVAGEASGTRAVRRRLRHELGLPKDRYGVVGYWRVRSEEWMRRYTESKVDLSVIYDDAERTGRDLEEVADEVDERLERVGL